MTELPPDVTDALRRGEPLEAMKRLRAAAHLSLRDAKAAIDRATGQPAGKPSLQEFFRTQAARAAKTATPDRAAVRTSASPQQGRKVDPLRVPQLGDLSPGEVPRRGSAWALAVVIGAAVYAWFRLRG